MNEKSTKSYRPKTEKPDFPHEPNLAPESSREVLSTLLTSALETPHAESPTPKTSSLETPHPVSPAPKTSSLETPHPESPALKTVPSTEQKTSRQSADAAKARADAAKKKEQMEADAYKRRYFAFYDDIKTSYHEDW